MVTTRKQKEQKQQPKQQNKLKKNEVIKLFPTKTWEHNKRKMVTRTFHLKSHSITTTSCFGALTSAQLGMDLSIPIHTLILGTHPGIKLLAEHEYYCHPNKYVLFSHQVCFCSVLIVVFSSISHISLYLE